jgi:hypothetical protein
VAFRLAQPQETDKAAKRFAGTKRLQVPDYSIHLLSVRPEQTPD